MCYTVWHRFKTTRDHMDYSTLLDLVTDLGYELAMCGAETFRVEESITRIFAAYGIQAEVFAIPNCLTVSIETADGTILTRMRRIGQHGNDLDAVERFNGLSRAICNRKPSPGEGKQWLQFVRDSRRFYSFPVHLLGNFLGAAGFSVFFGGNWQDFLCGGICGIVVGLVTHFLEKMKANPVFRTITAAFFMALAAYFMGAMGICSNADMAIIGALMILVPGLLFTNAMRDIIYGDTTSGVNRIVQVFLTAVALAVGTGAAWRVVSILIEMPADAIVLSHGVVLQSLVCFVGCFGFMILFNIHGFGGLYCVLGGTLTWMVYLIAFRFSGSDLNAYFWSSLFASSYSEIIARIRKFPAISYLVISIFPLIPGAGVYYTMNYAVRGMNEQFAVQGLHTAAIAGIIAVGILLASTTARIYSTWISQHRK